MLNVLAHPNLQNIIQTIEKGDDSLGFLKEASKFAGHVLANAGRSVTRAATRSPVKEHGRLGEHYESQLNKLASNFALCADLSLTLGGRIKFEEMLSGRYADAFGTLYLGYSCLWYYQQNKQVIGIDTVFTLAMETLLKQNQDALVGIADNFPMRSVGRLMKMMCFPFGKTYNGPTDKERAGASQQITTPSGIRDLLTKGIFVSENPDDHLRKLLDAFPKAVQADEMVHSAKKLHKLLTLEEQEFVSKVERIVDKLIQVDSFDKLGKEKLEDENYVRPGLKNTKFAEMRVPVPV
jgi:acyl-CoA dehydrogenase